MSAERGNTQQITSTCAQGPSVGLTNRAYSDADPGFMCPIATAAAAVSLLGELCCRCRTAVLVVVPAIMGDHIEYLVGPTVHTQNPTGTCFAILRTIFGPIYYGPP